MKLSSTIKGLITGLLMVAAGLIIYINKVDEKSAFQYVGYLIYGLGVVWSIVSSAVKNNNATFKEYFNEGFRCFVMITLILSVYSFVFWKTHPDLIESDIEQTKTKRIKEAKDRTLAEIEKEAEQTKQYYIPFMISGVIFSNLLTGLVVTVATSGMLYLRNKNS